MLTVDMLSTEFILCDKNCFCYFFILYHLPSILPKSNYNCIVLTFELYLFILTCGTTVVGICVLLIYIHQQLFLYILLLTTSFLS